MADIPSEEEKCRQSLVVVIDDDYDVLEWCRVILECDGFAVECFYDMEQAYIFLQRRKPALVLSDLMMADRNSGFDFAQRIKETPGLERFPIIILTAASSQLGFDFTPKSEVDLQAMHVEAYFSKPADPALLLSKIHELIARTKGTS
ncbi:MAG: Gliding motility regulatory protein [Candidatus Hydrogenedentes bacterium ADurb.Bin101]|nr:MAG: Gliding motility regulatory protein [Candidatus Hydrogenedentes bacterium ADurb.Bin101]